MSGVKKKKTKKNKLDNIIALIRRDNNIVNESMSDVMNRNMLIYGNNINLARSFPSPYDGLKLVQKRALWAMYKYHYNGVFKVSNIVGNILGKFHPHGDVSITDTIVNMGSPWLMQNTLIKDGGNFGTKAGDTHAAMRYISASLSEYAKDCYFKDFVDNMCDYKDAYTGKEEEPEYLCARYPAILLNGSYGIGYSMSTYVPIFNFNEVADLAIKLIKDPNSEVFIYPDSTRQCIIKKDDENVRRLCDTGRSKNFTFRVPIEIENNSKKNRITLNIRDVLEQTTGYNIEDQIKLALTNKTIQGVVETSIAVTTTKDGELTMSMDVKEGYDHYSVIKALYNRTSLEKSYSYIMNVEKDLNNTTMSVRDLLINWINYRRLSLRLLYINRVRKARKDQHIKSQLLDVYENFNMGELIDEIKKCSNKEDVITMLRNKGLSMIQADAVASTKLYHLNYSNIGRFRAELDKLNSEISECDDILLNPNKIDDIMISQLKEGKEKWGKERKAKIVDFDDKMFISDEDFVINVDEKGRIKKTTTSSNNHSTKAKTVEMFRINNKESLTIITANGYKFNLDVSVIPLSEASHSGYMLDQFIKSNKFINNIIGVFNNKFINKNMVVISSDNFIRKTEEYITDLKNGASIYPCKDTTKLLNVEFVEEEVQDIIVYTENGGYYRIDTKEITPVSRKAKGVMLKNESKLLGMFPITLSDRLLIVTEKGYMKIVPQKFIDLVDRMKPESYLIKLSDGDRIIDIRSVDNGMEELTFACKKKNKVKIKISDIPEQSRISKGKRLIKDTVITVL